MSDYNEMLKDCNAMDFDDLMLYALELFDKQPQIIVDFEHVLVDEVFCFCFLFFLILFLLSFFQN
jgi:superfamily I DNA/RNA helicase